MLIQDCFNDLGVVMENKAGIYQLVGDEVFLTWKSQNGLRNENCINAFYSFTSNCSKNKRITYKNTIAPLFLKLG